MPRASGRGKMSELSSFYLPLEWAAFITLQGARFEQMQFEILSHTGRKHHFVRGELFTSIGLRWLTI
jgi:hypothetical protein